MCSNMEKALECAEVYEKKIQDFALSLYEDLYRNIPDGKFTQQEINIMSAILTSTASRNFNYQISTALFWKGKDGSEEGVDDGES